MLNIKSKRKIVAVLSFVLGALLLITTAFAKNTSASAESSLSVEETAAKVYAVGVCPVYDYILAESNENYVCTLHFVFNIDTYYYNPDYEYGFFNAMYHDFLSVKETGTVSNNYAEKFEQVGAIEKIHEERYLKLAQNIEDDVVFKSDKVTVWKCRNCGHIYVGEEAPEVCPVCAHPQAYFEVRATNY